MRFTRIAAVVVAGFGLAGCGATPLEQTFFGATAGTGAAVITGGDPVTGAAFGAAANLAYCRIYGGHCR